MGGRTTLMGAAQILLSFSEDSRVSLRDPAVGKHTFYWWSLALWLDEHVFQLCVLLTKKKKHTQEIPQLFVLGI